MNSGGIDPLSELLLLPGGEMEIADFIDTKNYYSLCVSEKEEK